MNRDLRRIFGNLLLATAMLATLPWIASDFLLSLALTCLMYVGLAVSWSMFSGATNYLSLATSAFFGIGAYAGALSLETLPWLASIALGATIINDGSDAGVLRSAYASVVEEIRRGLPVRRT